MYIGGLLDFAHAFLRYMPFFLGKRKGAQFSLCDLGHLSCDRGRPKFTPAGSPQSLDLTFLSLFP